MVQLNNSGALEVSDNLYPVTPVFAAVCGLNYCAFQIQMFKAMIETKL